MKFHIKKIILFIILLLILSNSNSTIAKTNDSCSIKYSQTTELKNYFSSIKKITTNLQKNSNNLPVTIKTFFNSEALHFFNTIAATSWRNYYIEWNFKIIEPIFNDLPRVITRDTKKIDSETTKLNNLISYYAKRGQLSINIKEDKICNGIDNCNISGSIGNILAKLIISNNNIKEVIERASTNSFLPKKLCKNVIGITNSNCTKIYNDYYNAKQTCTNDDSITSIKNITDNFKYGENGFDKWKEARNLLMGNDTKTKKYNEEEKRLLEKELARQGLNSKQTNQILNNLKEYNQNGGYSLYNNPISNIIKSVNGIINDEQLEVLEQFKESIEEIFKEKEKASISEINAKLKIKKIEKLENYNIDILYNELIPMAQLEDLDSSQIIREILKMNLSINTANNTLIRTIPLSIKVCNQQGKGQGKCKY